MVESRTVRPIKDCPENSRRTDGEPIGLCCVQAELERQLSAQRDDNAVLTSENEALHQRIQQLTRDLVCITGLLTCLISVYPL